MPPKKKGAKKKVGKAKGSSKGPTLIDGVPVSEMTKEQLEGHVRRLQEELAREREERNYYQLERDRVQTFWEVASKQLDECRAEARVKDRELEESEERHQTEVKVYKQKVKHLLYEQENHLADLKAENMVSLKVAREEHQKQELLHLQDKEQLSERLHEKDVQYQDLLRDTKLKHTEELESLRVSFENRQRETEKRYSIRFASLRTELHLRLKSEVCDTEERKNKQIDDMKRKHDRAFTEIKNYYNDITLNNLAMISTLKDEIKTKEEKLERNEQLLATVQQENKKLAEPLKKAKEQLAELQRQLGSQEKEKSALTTTQAKLKIAKKQVESLTWEAEVLQQKLDKANGDRNEIQSKFSNAILEMQQKSGLKYMVLEKKIAAMREELDIKDAHLHQLTSTSSSQEKHGGHYGSNVRNVVKEQHTRIAHLERTIMAMRQRREWGDDSLIGGLSSSQLEEDEEDMTSSGLDEDVTSAASSSSGSGESTGGSTGGGGSGGVTSPEKSSVQSSARLRKKTSRSTSSSNVSQK